MTDEERAEKAKIWDPRTPLERFESLTRQEQDAFLALFAGARPNLQRAWSPSRGELPIKFGKAECEWPDFDLWRYKLPGLRLTNYEESPRRVALGMEAGSVVCDCTITVTEDGWAARDEYWQRLKDRIAASAK